MIFLDLVHDLQQSYKNDMIVEKNGTLLLAPGSVPKARHILYRKLSLDELNECLINNYKNSFPKQYAELLTGFNGMNLFRAKMITEKFEFSSSFLTIFGFPRTPPSKRPPDEDEPFDVRIEDFDSPETIPSAWLRCGRYKTVLGYGGEADIYIDTTDEHVYSCNANTDVVIQKWDDLDECLCSIFEFASKSKTEYKK